MTPDTRDQQARVLDAHADSIEQRPSGLEIARLIEPTLIKAIRAGAQALRSQDQGWLPMETAPKDGRTVMLFYPRDNPAGIAEMGNYRRSIKSGRRNDLEGWRYLRSHSAAYDLDHPPTHWMPLPSPPTGE